MKTTYPKPNPGNSITSALAYHRKHGDIKTMSGPSPNLCVLEACKLHYPNGKPMEPLPELKPVPVEVADLCKIQEALRDARHLLSNLTGALMGSSAGDFPENSRLAQVRAELQLREKQIQELLLKSITSPKSDSPEKSANASA